MKFLTLLTLCTLLPMIAFCQQSQELTIDQIGQIKEAIIERSNKHAKD